MSELTFQTPELTLAGLSWGEGEPVVALHGWLDNAASFSVIAPKLNARVIALDARGHGHSQHVNGPYNIWDSLSDVLSVVNQLDQPVHLLGHSMGAGILSLFAGCFPEHVRSLNLIEGFGPWLEPSLDAPGQLRRAAISAQSQLPRPRPFASIEQAAQVRSLKGVSPVTAQAIYPVVERALEPTDAGYLWRSDPWLKQPSPLKLTAAQINQCLLQIRCPVRVALGAQGMLTNSKMFNQRLELCPDVQVQTFEGDHHLHLYEQPAEAIAEWFNQAY